MNLQGDNKGNIELIVFKKMQSRRINKSIKFKKERRRRDIDGEEEAKR